MTTIVLRAFVAATVVGLVMSARTASEDVSWADGLHRALPYAYAWALLAFVIVACDRWIVRRAPSMVAGLLWHLPLSLAVTAASIYLVPALSSILAAPGASFTLSLDVMRRALRWGVTAQLVTYGTVLGAYRAFYYFARYREQSLRASELQALLARSQLQVLRMQLEPHFLFNALNTISAHVESSPELARRMLEGLGQLLRRSLEDHDRQEVSLAQELECLRHYLAIQRARFEDRLTVVVGVPDEVGEAQVPALLLQPLVENAVRHGLAPRASGGRVAIEAARQGDVLHLRVVDDGVGLGAADAVAGDGRGLAITRQRLAQLYPAGAGRLEIRDQDGGGVVVEIAIPWRTACREPGEARA